jgi:hypothetical protein
MTRTITATLAVLIAAIGLTAGTAHAESIDVPAPEITELACPTNDDVPAEALTESAANVNVQALCEKAVKGARTPEAGEAIKYAFWALGSQLACTAEDRTADRTYDTSSLIARAYASAGLTALAGEDWAVSSRNIIGWDGVPRADWSIKSKSAKPGDVIGYKVATPNVRVTDMRISKKLVITAAGVCGSDVVRLADTLQNGDGIKRVGYYYIDPELAR